MLRLKRHGHIVSLPGAYIYYIADARMHLRETQWRAFLGLHTMPTKLPKMHAQFSASQCWARQLHVLDYDLVRMPVLQKENVTKIVQRYSATSPYAGYTQGNLYIVYGIGLVFADEQSVFWAFTRTVDRLHLFGPATPFGTRMLPTWIIDMADKAVPVGRDLWDLMLRLRWLYIMFGQTFTSREAMLAMWDYCLRGEANLMSTCAALLHRGISAQQSNASSPLEQASLILKQTVSTVEETAELISQAQLFLPWCGRSSISTRQQRLLAAQVAQL